MRLSPFRRVQSPRTGPLWAAVLALCAIRGEAATWTWVDGTNVWSTGASWTPNTLPLSDISTSLVFSGTGATSYTATHDLGASFDLNRLILQSSATVSETLAATGSSTLEFSNNGPTLPSILQNGIGAFTIDVGIIASDAIQFGGSGTGSVNLAGIVGADVDAGLNFTAGNWRLSNNDNAFKGGLTVGTGAVLELLPASGGTNLGRGSTKGLLGVSQPNNVLRLNGGTMKVSTNGAMTGTSGHITFGGNFNLTFGVSGGTLDLINSNPSQPGQHAGTIGYYNGATVVGGEIGLVLNNTAPAVVKFNGGEVGLSTLNNAQSQSGDWSIGQNALRFNSISGGGPLRVEVTNGALTQAGTGGSINYTTDVSTTYRGVAGGDPTSGIVGLANSGTSLTTGRVAFNRIDATYNSGLRLEDALQIAAIGGPSRIVGGITVAGTASGHPGFVTFSGRGTNSALNNSLLEPPAPPGGGTGHNVLWLGSDSDPDLPAPASPTLALTIQPGGKAVFDARVRKDTSNHSGVVLDGRAVLQAGGVLQISQSLSNFSPGSNSLANVGDIILRGPIEGTGNSVDEAVLDLRLPRYASNGTIATGIPLPLPPVGMLLLNGARPFGSLDADNGHQIIINGTGFGGLRVEANARPNGLFSGGVADPTPNTTKLAAYLKFERLHAITGSGGYLTGAPTGQTWSFPAGGEWVPEVPVGLRVTNHHPGGVDVSLGALTMFQHNLAVDAGATVDLGSAPFSFGPAAPAAELGTLHGKGTILAPGGLNVAIGGTIAPGMDDIGTLTVDRLNLSGRLEIEGDASATDVLRVVGDLVLGATSQLAVPAGTVLGPRNYRIASADTSSGTFGGPNSLPGTHAVSYSRPGEIWLSYAGGETRAWRGNVSSQWNFTAQNWSTPTAFQDGDRVVFDDTVGGGSRVVNLSSGHVAPASVLVNSAGNYTINSTFAATLTGTGELIKTGTGTLTLSGSASFEGGILVQQGTLQTATPDSIPDIGKVVIDAGAQLNLGAAERIEELIVFGGVTASAPLTVDILRLQGATSFQAPLILENKLVKSGAPSTLSQPIDLAGGMRLVQVASSTSPELTLAGAVTNGGLEKAGPGTLVLSGANAFPNGIIIRDGTLRPAAAGAIPTNTNVTVPAGTLDLNGIPHSLGALNNSGTIATGGAPLSVTSLAGSGGMITLGAGALQVTQAITTRYDGGITTTGMLTKAGPGSLALGGTNSITGGTLVNEGYLRIASPTAATVGTITVNAGGTLVADHTISAPIVLAGGSLGSSYEEEVVTGDLTVAAGTSSMIMIADPENPNFDSEVVILGRLRGSGDILVQPSPNGEGADRNQGMRLRGTAASDFAGTITLSQGVKMELQSSVAGPFSPAGTGKIVMNAGTLFSDRRGTFSQLNLRNNFGGDTVLGNDVEVVGSGVVNFGPVTDPDPLGQPIAQNRSRIVLGNLRIGGGQVAAVNKNGPAATTPSQTVQFSTVTLTGGDVGFAPERESSGFSFRSDLALGPISETAPSSLLMLGKANLYLLGANTYTGRTELLNGTTWLGAPGALPATTSLVLSGGTLNFQNRDDVSFDQTVASLSGVTDTLITNTAPGAYRNFTINQSSNTVFAGSIQGGLNVIKNGSGRLTLTDTNFPDGLFSVAGGELALSGVDAKVNGSLAVQNGGTLMGDGSVGMMTVANGGRLEPGMEIGTFSVGLLTMEAGATLQFEIQGASPTQFDHLEVQGTLALNGAVNLELELGFQPAFGNKFDLITNFDAGAIGGGGRFVYHGNVLENLEQFTVSDGGFEQLFEIRYDASVNNEINNDVIITAVPEPTSTALLLAGVAVCIRRRRK